MLDGLHHQSIRERIYKKLEPFPHPDTLKRVLDRLIFVIGFLSPLFTLPQVWEIWVYKNADGVSPVTWGALFIFAFFWLFYGIIHKEKPIIFMYTLWIIFNGLVALGAILY